MERNEWADRFVDNVVRRSDWDTITKTSVITLVLVFPIVFALLFSFYVFYENPDVFLDSENSILVALVVSLVGECFLASLILFSLTARTHRHLRRDMLWMDALIGYVDSKGGDSERLRSIRGEVNDRWWTVKTLFSMCIWLSIAVILGAIGIFMFYRVNVLDMDVLNVVYLSYALLLIQFIFTTGTTYRFPAKHDDAQHRFTKELQRCLPGIDQPAMGHEVRIGSRIIHIILFVVTLGLYSIPLLLLANHGMNKHIRNQWNYETDLMMKIIRNEGGIGVEGFGSNQPSNAFLRFLKNAL